MAIKTKEKYHFLYFFLTFLSCGNMALAEIPMAGNLLAKGNDNSAAAASSSLIRQDMIEKQVLGKPIKLPKGTGKIKKFYPAKEMPGQESKPRTIIYILESHTNYEVQKKMADLLDYFIVRHQASLVFVEGGVGDVGLAQYRSLGNPEKREEVGRVLLQKGSISAEEYLDLAKDYDLMLWGIENTALYDENLIYFSRAKKAMPEAQAFIADLEEKTNAIRKTIYSSEHQEFLEAMHRFETLGAERMAESFRYLAETAKNKGIGLEAFPVFSQYTALAHEEENSGFANIEYEKDQAIKALTKTLPYREIRSFIEGWKRAVEDVDLKAAYYEKLAQLTRKQNFAPEKSALFADYAVYIKSARAALSVELIEESRALKQALAESFLGNDTQKKMHEIEGNIKFLKDLFSLRLIPSQYARYAEVEAALRNTDWQEFLAQKAAQQNVPLEIDAQKLVRWSRDFGAFYKAAALRDQAMMENVLSLMNERDEKTALLIAGGFHEERLAKKMNEKGISVLVIMPLFEQETDQEHYFTVLGERWENRNW